MEAGNREREGSFWKRRGNLLFAGAYALRRSVKGGQMGSDKKLLTGNRRGTGQGLERWGRASEKKKRY